QRAHAVLGREHLTEDAVAEDPLELRQSRLLDAYVDAFWRKDIDAIVGLLTEDAQWEMPPFTGWYRGRERIGELIDTRCPGGPQEMPMLPTRAHGQPAFGLYMARPDGTFVPFQLQVLTLRGGRVAHVVAFFQAGLFERFGLPTRLPELAEAR